MSNKLLRKLITLALIIVISLIFAFTTDSFFNLRNIQMLMRVSAYVGLVCIGTSFVMIGGGIDLSTGGIICFSGVICARLAAMNAPVIIIILGAVACGVVCGFINGFCITRFHLNDFITTLASGYVFSGFALATIFKDDSGRVASIALKHKPFLEIGKSVGGLYYIAIAWIILTIVALIIQKRTRFGLHVTAMGSNLKSSDMSGINTSRLKIVTYMICGAACGLAAAFTVANQGTTYLSLGDGKGFEAVAACVVGGVALGGGKGDAAGAFLGALFMTLVTNGMYKYGLGTAWQYVFEGAVILVAIMFDTGLGSITAKRLKRIAHNDDPAEEALH